MDSRRYSLSAPAVQGSFRITKQTKGEVMKPTIEACQERIEAAPNATGVRANQVIGLGLCAVAYAIRDLAIAVKQAQEARQSGKR